MRKRLFYILCIFLFYCPFLGNGNPLGPGDSIVVSKIWDQAPYNSFTSLIRFKDAFYCSFREGISHVSKHNEGKVRILRSEDGSHWENVTSLQIDGLDLRDPKLSVTPEHRIMVIMAGAVFDKSIKAQKLFPLVSFSDSNGRNFSTPEQAILDTSISPSLDWIWRITWHKGAGYGIDYQMRYTQEGRESTIFLMKTTDGVHFSNMARLAVKPFANESTIRFDNQDKMYVLIRKDAGDKMGVLAKSKPPYTDWSYTKLDYRLGGPDFLFLGKQKLVIGTREYGNKTATVILVTDLNGKILKTIKLPSGGDTSYPGMVIYKKKLWVSYYSSHEGKASIYLARIPLSKLD